MPLPLTVPLLIGHGRPPSPLLLLCCCLHLCFCCCLHLCLCWRLHLCLCWCLHCRRHQVGSDAQYQPSPQRDHRRGTPPCLDPRLRPRWLLRLGLHLHRVTTTASENVAPCTLPLGAHNPKHHRGYLREPGCRLQWVQVPLLHLDLHLRANPQWHQRDPQRHQRDRAITKNNQKHRLRLRSTSTQLALSLLSTGAQLALQWALNLHSAGAQLVLSSTFDRWPTTCTPDIKNI